MEEIGIWHSISTSTISVCLIVSQAITADVRKHTRTHRDTDASYLIKSPHSVRTVRPTQRRRQTDEKADHASTDTDGACICINIRPRLFGRHTHTHTVSSQNPYSSHSQNTRTEHVHSWLAICPSLLHRLSMRRANSFFLANN